MPFSRKLRIWFDHVFYQSLVWYLSILRWPDQPISASPGITWLELALDFEFASGIILPGNASRRTTKDGQRWRRGAADAASFVHLQSVKPTQRILQRIDVNRSKPRFQCNLCHRSCLWSDRHVFLKRTCAGKPETPQEAMRRNKQSFQNVANHLGLLSLLYHWGKKLKFLLMPHVAPCRSQMFGHHLFAGLWEVLTFLFLQV